MFNYFYRKLSLLFFITFGVTVFVFSLNYLFPTDVLSNMSGITSINEIDYEKIAQQYNLNDSVITQYFGFIGRLLDGDWGVSFITGTSIFEQVFRVLPATIELAMYALFYSFIVAIPLGILASSENHPWLDKSILALSIVGFSMPIFWLALLLILVFSIGLGWFPTSGRLSLIYDIPSSSGFLFLDIIRSSVDYKSEAFADAFRHLVLPTFVLAAYPTTVLIRTTRQSMKDVMNTSYVKAAKIKGLTSGQLLRRHGLRNGLLPVIQMLGIHFGTVITLAMVTEVIFAWPGVGSWLVDAIHQRDYPAIQGGLLVISGMVFVATILFDLLYMIFDPLARRHGHGKI
ncbi:peptide ABC transporter permease [Psychrosphaera saromensis]|uniref:Peptide ABC transporter permease n=1 Tax=Psychrosphaera saromensis TaxID=716813 RepID=A0A2S7UXG8_9GAMM|nr:ABC transporter permease [Psychrosphaera saromensis]PQJ54438.1 peptide ABC transporter permease [Psychrosphaera saromensis]GHB59940.1 peptide ABC transporter permease [Psychrosphaera saromensis]GLQ14366.1 peptide ABC transporter permease [Psychrosphaera saromensis]